jgi:hypothetical protein
MQRIFTSLKQTFSKKLLTLLTLSLCILSSLFIFIQQPSLAASVSTGGQKLIQQEKMDKQSQAANLNNQASESREEAYEDQVEAAKDPDKVYEENLKEFKKANPDEGIVQKAVEGAKEAVEKVTK